MKFIFFVLFIPVVVACSSSTDSAPPAHMVGDLEARVRHRIERIELIVDGRERSDVVVGIYTELEKVVVDYRHGLIGDQQRLWQLESDPATDEAAIRQAIGSMRQRANESWERYVALQLQVRQATTPDEFERIDALR